MRIGFLIDRWQPERGGAEAAMAAFARHLEERGHEVVAIGLHGPRPGNPAPGRFVRVQPFGAWRRLMPRGWRERVLGDALVAAARAEGCDLTIGARHLPSVDLFWPHDGCHRVSLLRRVAAKASAFAPIDPDELPERVVPSGRHRTFVELERKLCEGGARRIACVSEMVAAEFRSEYPTARGRLVVVPNGIDRVRFHPPRGMRIATRADRQALLGAAFGAEVDAGEPLLFFPGRDAIRKGLPALARSLALLLDRPWRLVVAGPKRFRDVERHLLPLGEPLGEGPSVAGADVERAVFARRWVYLPEVDTAEVYRLASLTLVPTWRDACSLAVLESLASGTRVVVTSHAGAASYVLDGGIQPSRRRPTTSDAGTVLVDAADEQQLAEVIAAELDRDASADLESRRWLAQRSVDFDIDLTHQELEAELLALAEPLASS